MWNQNERKIVPLYFEVKDQNRWPLHFADDYLRTCLTQYVSYLTRTSLPLNREKWEWEFLEKKAREINKNSILDRMKRFKKYYDQENEDEAFNIAVGTPYCLCGEDGYNFVIMIDEIHEIQYMTKYIYKDKNETIKAKNLPGIFHGMVELRFCPMLVSGSYIGWMIQMMQTMFVGGRLRNMNIPASLNYDEGMRAVFKYAEAHQVELSEQNAIAINILTQSNPYYMSTLFESEWHESDFSTLSGIVKTFANEIIDKNSELHKTWLEYIDNTLDQVNDKYAKKILLILSRDRDKEYARDEILKELEWSEDQDAELAKKLSILIYGNLVTEGRSAYHYKGIADTVLYLIFYHKYQYEIYHQESDVYGELYKKIEMLEKDKKSMQSRINELKGRMLELVVWRELNKCRKQKTPVHNFRNRIRSFISNHTQLEKIIGTIENTTFDMVYMNYFLYSPATTPMEMDVLALKEDDNNLLALAFETKNRIETNLPSMDECKLFLNKISWLKNSFAPNKQIVIIGIYFSANGFSDEIEQWLHDHAIVTVDYNSWDLVVNS